MPLRICASQAITCGIEIPSIPLHGRVPDALAFDAHCERVLVLRFKYNTDLLAEINRMVQQEKVQNAVILSGFGSVRNYQVHQVGNRDLPAKDIFVKDPTAPADIIGMSGFVIGGRVHAYDVRKSGSRIWWPS